MTNKLKANTVTPAAGLAIAVLLGVVLGTPQATQAAPIDTLSQWRTVAAEQTAVGVLQSRGAYFVTDLGIAVAQAPNYTSATMTGPAMSLNLDQTSVNPSQKVFFAYAPPLYPTAAVLNVDFPLNSTYTYTLAGAAGTPDALATFDVGAAHYAQSAPQVMNFAALQNMNAGASQTLSFNDYLPADAGDTALTFVSVYNRGTNVRVFDASFLPTTTHAVTIAAGTLLAGHDYTFDISFSSRVASAGTGSTFAPSSNFDLRTFGNFSTAAAVPEPSSFGLMGLGLLGLGLARRRAKR